MKKRLIIGLTLVLVLAFGIVTFAESADVPDWYNDMLQWRQERLEAAVEEGLITEEQAQWQQERWEAMDEFHREQGFGPGVGPGFGPCHGNGFGGGRFGGQRGSFNGYRNVPVN